MSTRIWMLVTAIACVAIIALGYVLGVAPKLAEAGKADMDRLAVEQQNAIYEDQLSDLITQYKGIDDIRAQLEELRVALPDVDDELNLLDAIALFAENNGVVVASFTQGDPVPYGEVGAAGTLVGVPITLTVSGMDYVSVMAFVKQLQEGDRLFMVSKFTLSGGEDGFTLDLAGYAYTLVAGTLAAPTPEAPEPTETEIATP